MSEDEKQYFEWIPYEGTEEKEKILIKDFKLFSLNKNLDRKKLRGVPIKGLIKILAGNDEENIKDEYNIEFKGRMLVPSNRIKNNYSEIEKALREHYNDVSKKWMRMKREKEYKRQIQEYFPKKELEDNLKNLSDKDEYFIALRKIKDMIYNFWKQNNIVVKGKNRVIYQSNVWQNAIDEFMSERGYTKEGDKYVKKK